MGAHNSVISLFDDVTKNISDKNSFGYGAASDFDSIKDKTFPFVWLDPLRGTFPNRDEVVGDTIVFTISLNFLDFDDKLGNERETAQVWDAAFDLMEKWIHKLDREFINDDDNSIIQSNTVSISNVSWQSRRKGTADILSGWTLTFDLTTPSDFDYCSIYE